MDVLHFALEAHHRSGGGMNSGSRRVPELFESHRRPHYTDAYPLQRSDPSAGQLSHPQRLTHEGDMPVSGGLTATSSNSNGAEGRRPGDVFALRHGRKFLLESSYPLPSDLHELQRQNLKTLLVCRVFGRAVCSPRLERKLPRRVLDLGCGTGYWSAMCHDYFASLGRKHVAFTGLDIAPLAPNLNDQGLNWTFVQHDFRTGDLPFADGAFDLVMCKDNSLAFPDDKKSDHILRECIRVLSNGGTIEIWDTDHIVRSILSNPPKRSRLGSEEYSQATKTGTVVIEDTTTFCPPQNQFVQDANAWINKAFRRRGLQPTPAARIAETVLQERSLSHASFRRVAVPLNRHYQPPDELDAARPIDSPVQSHNQPTIPSQEAVADQAALRETALMTVVQGIENLEVAIREVNKMNEEEWVHWWSSMKSELLDPSSGALSDECLEVGAWWATKQAR